MCVPCPGRRYKLFRCWPDAGRMPARLIFGCLVHLQFGEGGQQAGTVPALERVPHVSDVAGQDDTLALERSKQTKRQTQKGGERRKEGDSSKGRIKTRKSNPKRGRTESESSKCLVQHVSFWPKLLAKAPVSRHTTLRVVYTRAYQVQCKCSIKSSKNKREKKKKKREKREN